MAEMLQKMEGNILSAFLEENCNFLMFQVVFFNYFFFKERKPETLLKTSFPELCEFKLWGVTVSKMKATMWFQRQVEEGALL